MKKMMVILIAFSVAGCVTTPPRPSVMEVRQAKTLDCVKNLIEIQTDPLDALEICRQVYGVKKVRDPAPREK